VRQRIPRKIQTLSTDTVGVPACSTAPLGTVALDLAPEALRVIENAEMAELVDDDVVEDLERGEHQPPVERDRTARRARAPKRALIADSQPRVPDAEAGRLLLR
jgi:hypothetical protein